MANLKNQLNAYAESIGYGLFDEIPKSVFAAIAVSALTAGGENLQASGKRLALEWETLNLNGVVPQKPGKLARVLIAAART